MYLKLPWNNQSFLVDSRITYVSRAVCAEIGLNLFLRVSAIPYIAPDSRDLTMEQNIFWLILQFWNSSKVVWSDICLNLFLRVVAIAFYLRVAVKLLKPLCHCK